METATGIEIKLIYGADLETLKPWLESRGWVPLNPMSACAFVAYQDDTIVGFVCQNPIPHVEPLFVSADHRGTGLAAELVKRMVDFLYEVEAPAAYIIANNPASAKLAEAHGMEKVAEPVYRIVRK
jgi:RimJ/RimL family protein N-acetyltransferase